MRNWQETGIVGIANEITAWVILLDVPVMLVSCALLVQKSSIMGGYMISLVKCALYNFIGQKHAQYIIDIWSCVLVYTQEHITTAEFYILIVHLHLSLYTNIYLNLHKLFLHFL